MIIMPKKQLFLVRFAFVSNSGKVVSTIPVVDESIDIGILRTEIYRKILHAGMTRNNSPKDIDIEAISCFGNDILSNIENEKGDNNEQP